MSIESVPYPTREISDNLPLFLSDIGAVPVPVRVTGTQTIVATKGSTYITYGSGTITFTDPNILDAVSGDHYKVIVGGTTSAIIGGVTYNKASPVELLRLVSNGTWITHSGLDASQIISGTIDAARLPSYVDDVLEYANFAAFPATGEVGKIYVALDKNEIYRWSGTVYIKVSNLNNLTPITLGLTNTASGTNASAVGYNNTSSANNSSTVGFQNFTVGIPQVETATVVGSATAAGNLSVTVTSALVTGSPLVVSVPLTTAQNTASLVAAAVRTALDGTAAITTHYTVGGTGATYTLTAKVSAANDTTLNMAHAIVAPLTGITNASTSANTVVGTAGINAAAFGKDNASLGENSSSFGTANTVSAINSVAVGNSNRIKSTGLSSVAFGVLNNIDRQVIVLNETTGIISGTLADRVTYGKFSTAVGLLNAADGDFGCAVGYNNTASQLNSTAVGKNNNITEGQSTTAVGSGNTVAGAFSTAVGYNNETAGAGSSTAIGNANVANVQSTAVGLSNNANIQGATAVGFSNNASTPAVWSSAFGHSNNAYGQYSTAIGSQNTVNAINSMSIGRYNLGLSTAHASINVGILNNTSGTRSINGTTGIISGSVDNPTTHGRLSTAVGILNITSGANSTAIGYANTTSGANSSTFGYDNTASAANAVAYGVSNTATLGLVAVGYNNTASTGAAVAVGGSNTASGSSSIAFGFSNNASGTNASAFGSGSTASAFDSSAFGRSSTASGTNSCAVGRSNTASGANSSAFGYQTITSVAGTQEFGIGTGSARLSSVRVHDDGYVALSLRDTATALTDGGATVGAEADGTLMRGAYAIRRNGSNLFIDANSSTGTITSARIGDVSLDGSEVLTNKTLTNPTINNYTEGVVAIGNSGTSQTIALTLGTFQTVTLTGSCTFTMPTATAGKSFILKVLTGAGGFTATFTGVKWPDNAAPIITATAGRYDLISFIADGTAWSGSAIQNFTP
jgi:hypothetical protein